MEKKLLSDKKFEISYKKFERSLSFYPFLMGKKAPVNYVNSSSEVMTSKRDAVFPDVTRWTTTARPRTS